MKKQKKQKKGAQNNGAKYRMILQILVTSISDMGLLHGALLNHNYTCVLRTLSQERECHLSENIELSLQHEHDSYKQSTRIPFDWCAIGQITSSGTPKVFPKNKDISYVCRDLLLAAFCSPLVKPPCIPIPLGPNNPERLCRDPGAFHKQTSNVPN